MPRMTKAEPGCRGITTLAGASEERADRMSEHTQKTGAARPADTAAEPLMTRLGVTERIMLALPATIAMASSMPRARGM